MKAMLDARAASAQAEAVNPRPGPSALGSGQSPAAGCSRRQEVSPLHAGTSNHLSSCVDPGIEVFYLPKYAPERNPEEYLNCDVKASINMDGLPKDRGELQGKLHRFMRRLAKPPARIASYFEHKYIAYAAVPELNPI